jgi:hypothetical protein
MTTDDTRPLCVCGHSWDTHYIGCMYEPLDYGDCPHTPLDRHAALMAAQSVADPVAAVAGRRQCLVRSTTRRPRQRGGRVKRAALAALLLACTATGSAVSRPATPVVFPARHAWRT